MAEHQTLTVTALCCRLGSARLGSARFSSVQLGSVQPVSVWCYEAASQLGGVTEPSQRAVRLPGGWGRTRTSGAPRLLGKKKCWRGETADRQEEFGLRTCCHKQQQSLQRKNGSNVREEGESITTSSDMLQDADDSGKVCLSFILSSETETLILVHLQFTQLIDQLVS